MKVVLIGLDGRVLTERLVPDSVPLPRILTYWGRYFVIDEVQQHNDNEWCYSESEKLEVSGYDRP